VCAKWNERGDRSQSTAVAVSGTNGSRLLRGFAAINPLKPISDPIRCVKLIYAFYAFNPYYFAGDKIMRAAAARR